METIKITKNNIQREAFQDFISDYPRVIAKLEGQGWPCSDICYRAMVIDDLLDTHEVPADLSDLDKAILKAAIEKSEWLADYEGKSEWAKGRNPEKLRVLRECAETLDILGIEVTFIPNASSS